MKGNEKQFSIIDEGFTVEGTVVGNGRLIIKGSVKGSLQGDEVVIAEEGSVYAETKARVMTIGGSFDGELEVAQELVILATGKCAGTIKCNDLVLEAGGFVNASVNCKSAKK